MPFIHYKLCYESMMKNTVGNDLNINCLDLFISFSNGLFVMQGLDLSRLYFLCSLLVFLCHRGWVPLFSGLGNGL